MSRILLVNYNDSEAEQQVALLESLGLDVVRTMDIDYDRTGTWYFEHPDDRTVHGHVLEIDSFNLVVLQTSWGIFCATKSLFVAAVLRAQVAIIALNNLPPEQRVVDDVRDRLRQMGVAQVMTATAFQEALTTGALTL